MVMFISRVLVCDGSERAALAVVRSLGMKGIEVEASDSSSFNTSSLSRYCCSSMRYPSPEKNRKAFADWFYSRIKTRGYEAVYPVTDFTSFPLSFFKKKFSAYTRIPLPDFHVFMKAYDKNKTLEIASENGVPIPKTYFAIRESDLKKILRSVSYPAVVKPRSKIFWVGEKPVMLKVKKSNYVNSAEELIKKYYEIRKKLPCPIIQEFIEGEAYGVEALFNQGEPRAIFVHKRLREYPVTGGASTLRIGVKHPKLQSIALKLLKAMDWHGVAMVEFKVDSKGNPFLIEVNGRFWGSLPLAIASGVDFPFLLHKMVTEGDVDKVFNYRTGVKCRWLLPGDLLHFGHYFFNGPGRTQKMKEFFSDLMVQDDIISLDDPMPTLGAIGSMLCQASDVLKGRKTVTGEILK
ncbi:ATP-grasp domain-containing protein [Candidatus Micrarchaeota archaeon]|nr:ATP-grasp domain-containing protein [Candidatus Micrarchaeota archaeon]